MMASPCQIRMWRNLGADQIRTFLKYAEEEAWISLVERDTMEDAASEWLAGVDMTERVPKTLPLDNVPPIL